MAPTKHEKGIIADLTNLISDAPSQAEMVRRVNASNAPYYIIRDFLVVMGYCPECQTSLPIALGPPECKACGYTEA